nr:PREDICTED: uncharacterized protein LOC103314186 [Tribolium castaneum]|eukprot:XP_015838794.1 PREDICTED: uncharacterized protein LOC103314186 [Tribolium castaneum]
MSILSRPLRHNINLAFIRHYFWRKVKEGCECPPPPPDKIVEEKKCIPCSFVNWKPKPRTVIECKLRDSKKPKQPRRCYAGMRLKPPAPDCKGEEIDPFKKKCCQGHKEQPPEVKKDYNLNVTKIIIGNSSR